jgi:hypothetical protein
MISCLYCFKEPADAQQFMERFGGERFDPSQRGRGRSKVELEAMRLLKRTHEKKGPFKMSLC